MLVVLLCRPSFEKPEQLSLAEDTLSWWLEDFNFGILLQPYGFLIFPCLRKQARVFQQRCRCKLNPMMDPGTWLQRVAALAATRGHHTGCLGSPWLGSGFPTWDAAEWLILALGALGPDTKGRVKGFVRRLAFKGKKKKIFPAEGRLFGSGWAGVCLLLCYALDSGEAGV